MNFGKLLRTHWDRAAAIVFAIAAVIALLAGWARLSTTPYVAEQLAYLLSGGIGAVILLGLGGTLWLSADLHDEWRELDSIDEALRDLRGAELPRPSAAAEPTEHLDAPDAGLVSPGART